MTGPGSLIITATDVTSPANSAWVADALWVGAWMAPPPGPSGFRIYLPLVMKSGS